MTNLLCKIYHYSRLDVRLDKYLGVRRTLIVRGNSPEVKRSISRFIKVFQLSNHLIITRHSDRVPLFYPSHKRYL